jgi:hypothetical protein
MTLATGSWGVRNKSVNNRYSRERSLETKGAFQSLITIRHFQLAGFELAEKLTASISPSRGTHHLSSSPEMHLGDSRQ